MTDSTTTERRFAQTIIKVNGKNIRTEKYKVTIKQETETYTACDRVNAYAVAFGEETYEMDLTGVDPAQKQFFLDLKNQQNRIKGDLEGLPKIHTYTYDSLGEIIPEYIFTGVYIEEISNENNQPFDVKVVALSRVVTTNN